MEQKIITSWYRCLACSQPCEVTRLSSGTQSLCHDAMVEVMLEQPALPSKLPPSHPDAARAS